MTTRRRFFGLLGATPLAAKTALDEAIAKQTGIAISGARSNYPGEISPAIGDPGDDAEKAIAYMKAIGVPDFVEQSLRENTRVTALDPDIANKRSFSMSYKVLLQKQRNYDEKIYRIKTRATQEIGRKFFKQAVGWSWPWWHY